MDLVNNAGKNHLQIRASGHRRMSIDVKLRSLVTLWVESFPFYDGVREFYSDGNVKLNLKNFKCVNKVFNSDLEPIGNMFLDGFNAVCDLYDTDEKVSLLK